MDPIWDYLIGGLLPSDPKEATKLRTRSARFTVYKGRLYKRGFFAPSLSVLKEEKPTTYSRKYMKAYAETTSELGD